MSPLVDALIDLGVQKVRLTGGEPFSDPGGTSSTSWPGVSAKPGLRELAITTNGVLLGRYADALADAGLSRLTVSLDTLRPRASSS